MGIGGHVTAWRVFDARADHYARLSSADLAYGYQQSADLWPPRDVLDHALTAMPERATFRIAFGPEWRRGRTRWTNELTAGFLRFFLFPRREGPTGEWVFCFACDESRLEGRLVVMFESADGLRFGRLAS
jgi:hypothetical protein